MKWAVVATVVSASALASERPHLFATVQASPMTALPDFLAAFVTVHAIPYVDLQGGASFFPGTFGWWARGGPRVLFNDWRDEAQRGLTWRVALLGGYRAFRDSKGDARGVSFVLANDFTYFVAPHLGVTVSLSGGGLYDVPGQRFLPELRLGLGVSL